MISFNSRIRSALVLPIFASQLVLGVGCAGNTQTGSEPSATEQQHVGYDGQALIKGIFFNVGPAAEKMKSIAGDRPATVSGKSPAQLAAMLERATTEMELNGYSAEAVSRIRSHATAMKDASFKPRAPITADQLNASAEAIIAHISQIAPGFLEQFAADIQSGDPLRVKDALSEGGRKVIEAQAALTTVLPAMHTEGLTVGTGGLTKVGGVTTLPPIATTPVTVGGGLNGPLHHAADDLVVVDTAVAIYAVAAIAAVVVLVAAWDSPITQGELEREQLAGRVATAYGHM